MRMTQLRGHLRHLLLKKVPWLQDARPQDETHRVQRPHDKKGAAKRSLAPKKALACFLCRLAKTAPLHWHVKTPCCLQQLRAEAPRSKPSLSKGLW